MKKITIYTLAMALIVSFGFTQKLIKKELKEAIKNSNTSKIEESSYPICGTTQLIPKEQELIEYYRAHPELKVTKALAKPAFNYVVGSTHNFYASSWVTNEHYLVAATCRAVGENCYVFVADDNWNASLENGPVDQAAVDAIVDGFDNTTPNFPTKGIYEVDVETFGTPPNTDGDPKIIILILDIDDGYTGSGGYIAGYYSPLNQTSNTNSNQTEMFYMDCNPAMLINETGRLNVLNTTAHEFQHMIHDNWDADEISFPNEGLSEIASYICGYEFRNDGGYRDNTNIYLFGWDNDDALPDYTRAALWTLYLLEQHPNGFLEMLVKEQKNGGDGINQALATYGASRTWQEIFEDWLIANYLQDVSVDPKWGYLYPDSRASTPVATHTTPDASGSGEIIRTSGQYVSFTPNPPESITFTIFDDSFGNVSIKAIKKGDDTVVDDVQPGVEYTVSPNGETYTDVTFCLINKSDFTAYEYNYEATGEYVPPTSGNYELFYEDGEPDGTLGGYVSGDSIAVRFDGYAGGKLDSIKTIFSGAGRIKLDISKLGSTNFLRGTPLITAKNVNVAESTEWKKIDLTSSDIDASSDFVVSYLLGTDPYEPCITVSQEPDDGSANSFSYRKDTDDWVRYTGAGETIWKYMIRAYVSVGGGTVAIDQNGILSIPDAFSLEQNYPNPFNPSTTFQFATPKDGLVKFTVHDLLGREIYSENRNLLAGNYAFTWDGQNNLKQHVVSGVYFLKMETDGFIKTRKMLMMK